MPRTRRHCLDGLACGLLAVAAGVSLPALAMASTAAAPPDLQCVWSVDSRARAGGPVELHFILSNPGRRAVQVLEWGTPFEGWLSPYVVLARDGVALAYGGASVKRGDPAREEYLRIAPGRQRRVSIDLAEAFDLGQPGRYELRPRILLHDVYAGAAVPPRPRSRHMPQPLECPALNFTLAG